MKSMPNSTPLFPSSFALLRALRRLAMTFLLVLAVAQGDAATVTGELKVGGSRNGRPKKDVKVILYEATEFAPIALAQTTTDDGGRFVLTIDREVSNSIFFLKAEVRRKVNYLAILGKELPETVAINEISSVASSYSMAQFYRTGEIAGDAFRLQIASQMYGNIVKSATGGLSEVLRSSPNADETNSQRLTRSLGNLLSHCAKGGYSFYSLRTLTKNESGQPPSDTAEALANLARNPSQSAKAIYRLSRRSQVFSPVLTEAPDQWSIAIKLNDTGRDDVLFGGPANVDWDSWGNAWVSNNVIQGSPNSTRYNVVLRPDGRPADGANGGPVSPIATGGLLGVGWGVSVDQNDNAWFGNFGWGSPKSEYFPSQTRGDITGAGTGSVSRFYGDGSTDSDIGHFGPYRVQGIEPDDYGNIWMASFGDRERPDGSGVWVYKGGDPADRASSTVDWENAPFGVGPVPDASAAWVTFSGGLAGKNPSSIAKYELTDSGELEQLFEHRVGKTLKVVAVDYAGNAWFASQGTDSIFAYGPNGRQLGEYTGGGLDGPWGITLDGEGNVWVSNFGPTEVNNDFNVGRLSKFCGANPAAWPKGLTMGDPISPDTGYTLPSAGQQVLLSNGDPLYGPGEPPSYVPMMRQTSVKIDFAGNIWTINNWKPRFDVDAAVNPGGDGVIVFVGMAPPRPQGH